MCLAIPGRVTEWLDQSSLFATAHVDFGGIQRKVNMTCALEAAVDDYVLVHAGIAISRIDPLQAEQLWRDLAALGIAKVVEDDLGPTSASEAGTLSPSEAGTLSPSEAGTPAPSEAGTPAPSEAGTPAPSEAGTLSPTAAMDGSESE